jgi:hypothetical protein
MIPSRPAVSDRTMTLIAAVILIPALAVDLGWVRGRDREVRRLASECRTLRERALRMGADIPSARELASIEAWKGTGAAADSAADMNPIRWIGAAIEDSGLERCDLATRDEPSTVGRLAKESFSLRARGSYAHILDFVRRIESGRPLAVIEDLTIEPDDETQLLDARISMSIYRPRRQGG